MKKLLFVLLALMHFPVFATNYLGNELTYTCLSGSSYEVSLSYYRDCSAIGAPANIPLVFACSANSSFNFTATLQPVVGTGIEITQGCSATPTSCNGGSSSNFGVQEYIYTAIVNLPPCAEWKMSYSSCCRNPVTTSSSSSNGWYIDAMLDNLNIANNNSPRFANKPEFVICNGQNYTYNLGAFDLDGDSLSYSFFAPKTSSTASINYNYPYSSGNFLASSSPIAIDVITGDIHFIPTMNLTTVVGVEVEEWRKVNGIPVRIGIVHRDVVLVVETCNNNSVPVLSGMDTLLMGSYSLNDSIFWREICSGKKWEFNIYGFDADTYNSTVVGSPEKFSISWDNGIPGATFQTFNNGTDSAYAHFYWKPTADSSFNIQHCFTATIQDDACPYRASQSFKYCATFRKMYVDIGSDTSICEGEDVLYTAVGDSTTISYKWIVNGSYINPIGPWASNTIFLDSSKLNVGNNWLSIQTDDGGTTQACPGHDIVQVQFVYQPKVDVQDVTYCDGNTVILDAGQGQSYTWLNPIGILVGTNQTLNLDSIIGFFNSFYTVIVDGGYNTRCIDADTVYVGVINNPDLGNDTCYWLNDHYNGVTIDALNGGNPYSNNMKYDWSTGATTKAINVTQSGIYSVTTSFYSPQIPNSSTQCIDEVKIDLDPSQKIVFSLGSDTTIGYNDVLLLKAPKGLYSYTWSTGDSLSSIDVAYDNGLWKKDIWVQLSKGLGCAVSDQITIFFGSVGIDELEVNSLSISPVPFYDIIHIQQGEFKYKTLELYSIDGKLLLEIELENTSETIDLSALPSGTYILKSKENPSLQKKIVKL